jgi:hypothetical protein
MYVKAPRDVVGAKAGEHMAIFLYIDIDRAGKGQGARGRQNKQQKARGDVGKKR